MPIWDIAIIDGFGITDFPLVANYVDVFDGYSSIDSIITDAIFSKAINDSTLIKDYISYLYVSFNDVSLAEILGIIDIPSSLPNYYNILSETPIIWDTPEVGWGKVIADALTITDSAEKILGLLAYDYMKLAESIHTNWSGVDKIEDSTKLLDIAEAARIYLDTLADAFNTADVATKILALTIIDYLLHDDAALSNLTADRTIADILSLVDSPEQGFGHTIADSLSLTDTALSLWILAVIAQDALNFADVNANVPAFNNLVAEGVNLADSDVVQGSYISIIQDEVNFIPSIVLDGEVYQCWVLNTDDFYPSIYTNYDFNSYVEMQGNVYATDEDGIHILGGTQDSGVAIATGVQIDLYNMKTHMKKTLRKAYFGMVGTKPAVKAITEEGEVQYYIVDEKVFDTAGNSGFARGHKGREWKFNLTQINALDFIEMAMFVMSK